MKSLFLRLLAALALLVLTACGTGTPTSDGPVLNLLASSNSVKVGETFVLTLQVEGVSGLTAFEAHLSFDPALLEVVSIQPGGFVQPDFIVQNIFDNTAGTIDYAAAQFSQPAAQGSGALLMIEFRARAGGKSVIGFRGTPAAPDGAILADADGYAIQVALGQASVSVTP
jgi:hypothetical protein